MLTTATFIPWDNLWAIVTINRQLTRFFMFVTSNCVSSFHGIQLIIHVDLTSIVWVA